MHSNRLQWLLQCQHRGLQQPNISGSLFAMGNHEPPCSPDIMADYASLIFCQKIAGQEVAIYYCVCSTWNSSTTVQQVYLRPWEDQDVLLRKKCKSKFNPTTKLREPWSLAMVSVPPELQSSLKSHPEVNMPFERPRTKPNLFSNC